MTSSHTSGATDVDDDVQDYRRGPGCRRPASGPVLAIYAETGALRRHCTQCGAVPHEFCYWPDGTERITPCHPRTKETSQ